MEAFIFFLKLVMLFFIGTTFGWFLELFFRRAVHGKWVNPGFLVGPCIPLYGFGTVFLFLLSLLETPLVNAGVPKAWAVVIIIVLIGITMTLIEYIAGVIFIKGMNVKLWDYSNQWGNIDGIICPLFSFFWLVIGAAYYFLLHPLMINVTNSLVDNHWLFYILGFLSGILLIDFSYSIQLVHKVKKFAKEKEILVKWETLKETISEKNKELKERTHFIVPFHTSIPLKDTLTHYMERANDFIAAKKNKKNDKDSK